jgi:hypothetical protein
MMRTMSTLRITEAELARDLHAVLTKVQQGTEMQRYGSDWRRSLPANSSHGRRHPGTIGVRKVNGVTFKSSKLME